MLRNTFVSLSGYAHLHSIDLDQDGEVSLTLHLINECDGSRSDDLWVKCRVDVDDFPIVTEFEDYLFAEKSITVKFDAQYLGFQQCYSGMSENDPHFIVHVIGKLLNIHEYCVEDESVSSRHIHSSVNKHIVSHRLRA